MLIQGGCYRTNPQLFPNKWTYPYNTVDGNFLLEFTAPPNVVPKIGDSIDEENNVLVVNTELLINDDHSKWISNDEQYWGRG